MLCSAVLSNNKLCTAFGSLSFHGCTSCYLGEKLICICIVYVCWRNEGSPSRLHMRRPESQKMSSGHLFLKIILFVLNEWVVVACPMVKSTFCLIVVYSSCFLHCSLRLALLNEAKEVRAAGLRALRYLIRDSSILQKVLKLKVDYLIAR